MHQSLVLGHSSLDWKCHQDQQADVGPRQPHEQHAVAGCLWHKLFRVDVTLHHLKSLMGLTSTLTSTIHEPLQSRSIWYKRWLVPRRLWRSKYQLEAVCHMLSSFWTPTDDCIIYTANGMKKGQDQQDEPFSRNFSWQTKWEKTATSLKSEELQISDELNLMRNG